MNKGEDQRDKIGRTGNSTVPPGERGPQPPDAGGGKGQPAGVFARAGGERGRGAVRAGESPGPVGGVYEELYAGVVGQWEAPGRGAGAGEADGSAGAVPALSSRERRLKAPELAEGG